MSSSIFRIETQIREKRQAPHLGVTLDTNREDQERMTASPWIPAHEPSLPTNEEVEEAARNEKNSPELMTDVRLRPTEEVTSEPDKTTERQTVSLIASIVDKTQHALLVDDRSLCKNLAQIYQESVRIASR